MIDLEDIKIKILQDNESRISYTYYDYDYELSQELNNFFEIIYPTHNKCGILFNESFSKKYTNRLASINLFPHLKRSVEKENPITVSNALSLLNSMTEAINSYRTTRSIMLEKRGRD